MAFLLLSACQQKMPEIGVTATTRDAAWETLPAISPNDATYDSPGVQIDPDRTLQEIDGFGASFNELGWEALQLVTPGERETIMVNLFDQDTGCAFNLCRVPIGANDYAVSWYSHNETPGDFEMDNFSIERDRKRLLPYIHKAMEHRPDLKVWGSPWSPPVWMKTNKHYACASLPEVNDLPANRQGEEMKNQFIMEEPFLSAYALYISKFVKVYRDEGINMYAVHVQNEPNSCQNFPSCIWRPEALATFIGDYLGPKFEEDQLDAEIWLGTIERAHPERVDTVLQDEKARSYITGVGFQWAGKGVIPHVNENYPDLELMQTETECGDGSNDWDAMEYTLNLMKHYFTNGANSYLYWNMILDHTGSSQWGWKQNSMITVTEEHEVVYNPEFYLMKHFSHFIEPGARFLDQDNPNCLAFLNPDKSIIIVYYNNESNTINQTFQAGDTSFEAELSGKALYTFQLPGGKS